MTKYRFIISLICFGIFIIGYSQKFDARLAKKLGADEYGMKSYVLVILKTGTNSTTDKKPLDSLFRGHMDNIQRLSAQGKLIVAGPMRKNPNNYRGIFILDVKTQDEAQRLLSTDPTIREKIFDVELYDWYGSAALPTYLPAHTKIEKKSINNNTLNLK